MSARSDALKTEAGAGAMNDYFAGKLASEHQADLLREVAKDEQAAALRRGRSADRRGLSDILAAATSLRRHAGARTHHMPALSRSMFVHHRP